MTYSVKEALALVVLMSSPIRVNKLDGVVEYDGEELITNILHNTSLAQEIDKLDNGLDLRPVIVRMIVGGLLNPQGAGNDTASEVITAIAEQAQNREEYPGGEYCNTKHQTPQQMAETIYGYLEDLAADDAVEFIKIYTNIFSHYDVTYDELTPLYTQVDT